MSMLSRWTIGAIASKNARLSAPVAAPMLSASAAAVSGPVATMVRPGVGQRVDPLAHDLERRLGAERRFDLGGEHVAVDRQRRAGRHLRLRRRRHHQRIAAARIS